MSLRQQLRELSSTKGLDALVVGIIGLFIPAMLGLAIAAVLGDTNRFFAITFPMLLLVINLAMFFLIRPTESKVERSYLLFAILGTLRLVFVLTR